MNTFKNLQNQIGSNNPPIFFRDAVMEDVIEVAATNSIVWQPTRRLKHNTARFSFEHEQPPAVTEQEERLAFEHFEH